MFPRHRFTLSLLKRAVLSVTFMAPLAAPLLAQTTSPATPIATGTRPSEINVLPPAGGLGPRVLEGLPIQRVEVIGNTRTDSRVILDQIRAQPGQPYNLQQLNVDLKSISSLDRFVAVDATVIPIEDAPSRRITGVIVQFKVEERAVVASVEITGNRKFTVEQLREGLLTRSGTALDPFRIETDRKNILEQYHKKGYAQVTVEVDRALLEKGIVRFAITEGPLSQIASIVFDGNYSIKTSLLKFKIQTKTYMWIFRKGLLDEEKLQGDLVIIRQEYLKKGYLDARVSYTLDYSEDKKKINLRFEVIEGARYKIRSINFTGNTVFAPYELMGATKFGPGAYAESDRIEALKKHVIDVYGHQGYINVNDNSVQAVTAFTETPGVVDLNINLEEGKPYVVGRVIIRGNSGVQDRVLRREVRIYPDQTFDMVLVKKSIDYLRAVGGNPPMFADVKITPVTPPGNPEGVQDALVKVNEGQTGHFTFGAGVSTTNGLVGQFSLEQHNFDLLNPPHSLSEFVSGQSFKGAGQFFQLLLEPGTEFQRYRINFQEPSLFDTPYSFGNDIYYFTRARESWDERRIGDVATFGRRFGEVWFASVAVRAEQVTITNPSDANGNRITDTSYYLVNAAGQPIGPYNDSAQQVLDGENSHFLTSIKPAITRDTTDSRIFPTTGSRASLAWEQYGALGGDTTMSKITLGFNWYTPLYTDLFDRKTVFSFRNQVGLIPLGTSPFYERFYLGGIGELRGFKFRGISPRSGPLNDPVGGDFSWVTTAEVNYPIYEELLRGVVFLDLGTVESDITIDTIRSDFGLGVRINLPFFQGVPLALDFAYPTTKASGDRTQIVSVSLGVPF